MGSLKVDKLNFFWNATFQSGNLCQNNDKESIFIQKLDAFQMGFLSSLESTLIWGFNWLRNFALMISMENREKFLALGFSYAILVCNSLKVGRASVPSFSKAWPFWHLAKEATLNAIWYDGISCVLYWLFLLYWKMKACRGDFFPGQLWKLRRTSFKKNFKLICKLKQIPVTCYAKKCPTERLCSRERKTQLQISGSRLYIL